MYEADRSVLVHDSRNCVCLARIALMSTLKQHTSTGNNKVACGKDAICDRLSFAISSS